MSSAAVEQLIRTKRVYRPEPSHRRVYDTAFLTFRDTDKRLAPLYRQMNQNSGDGAA